MDLKEVFALSKVMTLKDAVAKYVHSGDHIALGGFTTDRKPYAAVFEILRQAKHHYPLPFFKKTWYTDLIWKGGGNMRRFWAALLAATGIC